MSNLVCHSLNTKMKTRVRERERKSRVSEYTVSSGLLASTFHITYVNVLLREHTLYM